MQQIFVGLDADLQFTIFSYYWETRWTPFHTVLNESAPTNPRLLIGICLIIVVTANFYELDGHITLDRIGSHLAVDFMVQNVKERLWFLAVLTENLSFIEDVLETLVEFPQGRVGNLTVWAFIILDQFVLEAALTVIGSAILARPWF